jgi:hypothetical protein
MTQSPVKFVDDDACHRSVKYRKAIKRMANIDFIIIKIDALFRSEIIRPACLIAPRFDMGVV